MSAKNFILFGMFCLGLVVTGCATKVERVGVEEKIDISGTWNDYDAMLVSKEMIDSCLKAPWLTRFETKNNRDPVIIVGHVANRSHEHINAQVFVKYLERELLNSGKVVFVASSQEREDIRAEREDQQKGYTDPETMKKMGEEYGADYILIGSVNSIKDEEKRKSVVFYQVNMELVDLETNTKVWMGQKELKKLIKKPRLSL